uniref:Uncharacterized protein n=1 Tax=Anopheles quadriannulatus TaxID=34691 RepID=A0A182XQZ9_ANOQN
MEEHQLRQVARKIFHRHFHFLESVISFGLIEQQRIILSPYILQEKVPEEWSDSIIDHIGHFLPIQTKPLQIIWRYRT